MINIQKKMKNLFYILAGFLLVFSSCDYNDENFEGLDDMTEPTNVKTIELTLSDEDYSSISKNSTNKSLAETAGLSSELSALKTSKAFTSSLTGADYIPSFLDDVYYTADEGYAIKVTYNYIDDAPEYLNDITGAEIYTATNDDYTLAWGESGNAYLTPSYPIENYANTILSQAYGSAEEGEVKVLSYNFYEGGDIAVRSSLDEDFESLSSDEAVELTGWTNYAESGDVVWQTKSYSNNLFPQCSAYGASGDVVSWLISPSVSLSGVENPMLTFDVKFGFYAGECLHVMISDDYNGVDPTSATWTDITSSFAFYHASSGYTSMYCPGIADLSKYSENPIYIAFKYVGNSSSVTTTVQIDNVQLNSELSVVENEAYTDDFSAGIDSWINVAVQGTKTWAAGSYGGTSYAKISAYNTTEEQEAWLVSPTISVPSGNAPQLNFQVAVGYFNASCLSVLVSTDFVDDVSTATWTDISNSLDLPQEGPSSSYSDFVSSGAYSLNDYLGQDVVVAFKYSGNGTDSRTTTYEVSDLKVVTYTKNSAASLKSLSTKSSTFYTTYYVPYEFNGSKWVQYEGVIMPNSGDYESMGFGYFSSSVSVDDYLKTFLEQKYPYAQEEDVIAVGYLSGSTSNIGAKEFIYASGEWMSSVDAVEVTEQFVKSTNGFVWDPSVVINLLPVKNSEPATTFYQAATDWVWENVDQAELSITNKGDGYVTSYGNNEYYTGCSAYYNNIDMRPAKALEQYSAGFEGLTDDEIVDLMTERLKVVMGKVLSVQYPDAEPIPGVDYTYTVNVGIYSGSSITDVTHSLVYKVVGVGEFEYVSGPTVIE